MIEGSGFKGYDMLSFRGLRAVSLKSGDALIPQNPEPRTLNF